MVLINIKAPSLSTDYIPTDPPPPVTLHLVEVAVDLRTCLVDGLDRRPAELKLPPGL